MGNVSSDGVGRKSGATDGCIRSKAAPEEISGSVTTPIPETVLDCCYLMSGVEKEWKHQSDVLWSCAESHSKGGKLVRLEFPRTEVQHLGDVAIV